MSINLIKDTELKQWLADLKARIRQSQIKAMIKVNDEMLRLYWDLGRDIVVQQMETIWGSGFLKNLSKELMSEFPDVKSFSEQNLYFIKQFYLFYSQDDTILQQVVAKLENANFHQVDGELNVHPIFQITWGHHVQIFTKCKSVHVF